MPLREQKKLQIRQNILTVASDLIGRLGYEQARMRDIADGAEISYQTLYNYFPTKAQILQALLVENMASSSGSIDSIISAYEPGTLLDTLHELVGVSMDVLVQHNRAWWREVTQALFATINDRSDATSLYQTLDEQAHEKLGELLFIAHSLDDLVPGTNLELLADVLFALIEYALLQFIMDDSAIPERTLVHLQAQVELVVVPYLQATIQT
ncbi:MAG: TetR/AcrR family transcriptional regulator [Pseudomonadales bacterium]|nr:TetR/AcrR family transcriptional regulator [Pseudomonadales bacterium]MDP6471916.1 TetR/AcrR family transcriptional regulator [Pseudomonadales bacterium]MDP6826814.1 TetR/AcrR family transcriptional regulator [Pseudomonadales bacterium]MDP6970908.1 TetR/AcrR family transcriptional regulator [Pseudomonadales bacterium]